MKKSKQIGGLAIVRAHLQDLFMNVEGILLIITYDPYRRDARDQTASPSPSLHTQ